MRGQVDERGGISDAIAIARAVRSRQTRAIEVCQAALARIAQVDAELGAFLEVFEQQARERAAEVDARVEAGEAVGPLAGVPIAIKDNICTALGRTTCASRMLAEYRSPYDATVVERIERAGGIIIGKTNLDEFGMGSSTENSALGVTRNPRDRARVPGGSSGGSAVAVAAGCVPLALGSDTGGSIRQPAAFCGVVGLKPTYGRVSRWGLVAYASSLDQIGPLAGNVADAALLLGVIAGHDERDTTCARRPVENYLATLDQRPLAQRAAGLRIGVVREYFAEGVADDVRAALEQAIETYRRIGAQIVEVSLPHARYCIASYYLIATAECSSNLARFDGVHYGRRAEQYADLADLYARSRSQGLGAEVKRRIMLGTFALSAGYRDAYYERALKARRLIQQDFLAAFEQADVLLGATTPTVAFALGEKTADPLEMYLADVFTTGANLAGLPAVSLPCGTDAAGLPIGMQLIGRHFGEVELLQTARLYERAACSDG